MARVALEDVSLTYPGGAVGIDGVSLDVADGEFVALVGPSGSGKTTVLRSVAGFLQPQRGALRIGERTVVGAGTWVPPEQRRLGMVFQQHAIWPHWDVARNVDYPLRLAKVDAATRRRRVEELLDLVGLSGLGRRNPAALSGGQRQRVALARALAVEPQALLLDEALSALDEPLRVTLRQEIKQLATSQRLTVLHVTHDRDEALALADRVVVLNEGRVEQVDAPEAIVTRPATPFVAQFMADARLLPARRGPRGVEVEGSGMHLSPDRVDVRRDGPAGVVALTPEGVGVAPDPDGDATVATSMFTRAGAYLQVDWNGQRLAVRTRGYRPEAGERVRVGIEHALYYGADTRDAANPDDPAEVGASHPSPAAGGASAAD